MDPLDTAIGKLRRRIDFVSLVGFGFVVALITPFWIAEPPPFTLYAVANLSFFFLWPAVLFVVGRWGLRRLRRKIEPIRKSIRDVGVGSLSGLGIMIDHGLFLQSIGSMSIVSRFFTSGGAAMLPTSKEAFQWTGPRRWRRSLTVSERKGKSEPVRPLRELRDLTGSSIAAAFVARAKAQADMEVSPGWMAGLSLVQRFSEPSLERIVVESDRIAAYLQSLVVIAGGKASHA